MRARARTIFRSDQPKSGLSEPKRNRPQRHSLPSAPNKAALFLLGSNRASATAPHDAEPPRSFAVHRSRVSLTFEHVAPPPPPLTPRKGSPAPTSPGSSSHSLSSSPPASPVAIRRSPSRVADEEPLSARDRAMVEAAVETAVATALAANNALWEARLAAEKAALRAQLGLEARGEPPHASTPPNTARVASGAPQAEFSVPEILPPPMPPAPAASPSSTAAAPPLLSHRQQAPPPQPPPFLSLSSQTAPPPPSPPLSEASSPAAPLLSLRISSELAVDAPDVAPADVTPADAALEMRPASPTILPPPAIAAHPRPIYSIELPPLPLTPGWQPGALPPSTSNSSTSSLAATLSEPSEEHGAAADAADAADAEAVAQALPSPRAVVPPPAIAAHPRPIYAVELPPRPSPRRLSRVGKP